LALRLCFAAAEAKALGTAGQAFGLARFVLRVW
jgi:hypothetical protein